MAPPKSQVWKYFKKKDVNTVSYTICFKSYKHSGNTTNLLKHLRQHPQTQKENKSKRDVKSSTSAASTSATSSSPPYTSAASTSAASTSAASTYTASVNISSRMIQETPSTSFGVVKEVQGQQLLAAKDIKRPYTISDAFQHVSSFSEGGPRYAAITYCILYFICRDRRPFHVVKGEGFCRLLKTLAPAYKIPSEFKIKQLLDEKYTAVYKEKFKEVSAFSVTCDVWSEMMTCKSFLGVTLHYLYGTVLKSSIIATRELSESHTSDYLGEQLVDILSTWTIDLKKIVAVVTDNGANMVRAVAKAENLGKNKHPLFCSYSKLSGGVCNGECKCFSINIENSRYSEMGKEKCACSKPYILMMTIEKSSSSDSEDEKGNYDFWKHHKLLAHGHGKKRSRQNNELSQYLSNPVSSLSSDPLLQWEDMKSIFPSLYKEARKHFCIMATSVPAERLFSKAGATMSKDRNRLLGKRLEKLLFLGDCDEICMKNKLFHLVSTSCTSLSSGSPDLFGFLLNMSFANVLL
ncbi:unnamed protein product [Psylliodes chrysocephalus]|uniref:Uncharacterized protein n=1 Tax=Psylliodes chrysocephalus TaxID=3402493 RepID=A0A9P0D304_9CUCU|nr:unnamed protein product [Psylliodes chrysocephala]